jgi:lipopolysaccharide export system permease protein
MLIFLSNQLIQYLNRAASGAIPGLIIMQLMMLELPSLLSLLMPLGFYVAMLLAYGRLYAESEMTVLRACGYGPNQLLKHSLIMATVVAVIVAVVMIWGSPLIYIERAKLLRATGIKTLVQTIMPGRFHAINDGREVFYVQSMSRDHSKAEQVFLAKRSLVENKIRWDVLWAEQAFAETDAQTGEDYIILQEGKEYQGVPGQAEYQVAEFGQYKARLPHPAIKISEDLRTLSTAALLPLNNPDIAKVAEMQWRISVPIMVFTLTLVAVPLSRINPRSGKYAKLLPAIIIYILYANLLFIVRNALSHGTIPPWLGMWWVHLIVAGIGLLLIWRNQAKLA